MIELARSHPEVKISSGCGDKNISAEGNISTAGSRVKVQILVIMRQKKKIFSTQSASVKASADSLSKLPLSFQTYNLVASK